MAHVGRKLVDVKPELICELADPSIADDLFAGSDCKATWICQEGHMWEASVGSRVKGSGCPYCSGTKVFAGFNDLATTHPDVAGELVYESDGQSVSAGSKRKLKWRCVYGHEWEAPVCVRVAGHGCPYCAGRKVLVGFNDLESANPELAAELVESEAYRHLYMRSRRKVAWRCGKGHIWQASVADRMTGHGCPVCANRKVEIGVNDLATTHPKLAGELVDGALTCQLTAGSRKQVKWRCSCGHEWIATPHMRAHMGNGCPYCSGAKVLAGYNDLATTHPLLATELSDAQVGQAVSHGSGKRVEWVCPTCGEHWHASPNERVHGYVRCPGCADPMVSDAELDFRAVVLELAHEDDALVNDKSLLPKRMELDVVLPRRELAFEFNGCFWHSEGAGVSSDKHLVKRLACEAAGYRLVTIWEDEWAYHRKACICHLGAVLGNLPAAAEVADDSCIGDVLYARDLEFVKLSSSEVCVFLDEWHVQGRVSATAHFGLCDKSGRLRAAMSVRRPQARGRVRRDEGVWEIVRYATCGRVPGGFSKLMSHAAGELRAAGETVRSWVSFSANDLSDGGLYETCGFRLDAELAPDYKYVGNSTGGKRVPKERFQRRRFRDDPALLWDESWTGHEAALANKLYRVYDSGKRRWVKEA